MNGQEGENSSPGHFGYDIWKESTKNGGIDIYWQAFKNQVL